MQNTIQKIDFENIFQKNIVFEKAGILSEKNWKLDELELP